MNGDEFYTSVWGILATINDSDFEAVAAQPATSEGIDAVETATGLIVPDWYKAPLCTKANGLAIVARDEVWPIPQLYDIGPAWTFYRGVVLLGIDAADLPEWASVRQAWQYLSKEGITSVLPLLAIVGDPDRYWGIDESGDTVLVCDGVVSPVNTDFIDVYAEQIADLVQRQKDMLERTSR